MEQQAPHSPAPRVGCHICASEVLWSLQMYNIPTSQTQFLTPPTCGMLWRAVSCCSDDCGRLALHWSSELGLAQVCQVLLEASMEAAAALTARVAAASADAEHGEAPPQLDLPNLLEMQVGQHLCMFAASCELRRMRSNAEGVRMHGGTGSMPSASSALVEWLSSRSRAASSTAGWSCVSAAG